MGNDALALEMPEPASVIGTSCRLAPERSDGTFHLPLRIVRRDLADGIAGVPLMLRFRIITADGRPLPGAVLDLWHRSPAPGGERLRAAQMSDGDGEVRFRTVFPAGDPHLAARLHAGGGHTFTGRFTFDPVVTRRLGPGRQPAGAHQITVVPRDRFDLDAGLLATVTLLLQG